jgi:hypothetical protein
MSARTFDILKDGKIVGCVTLSADRVNDPMPANPADLGPNDRQMVQLFSEPHNYLGCFKAVSGVTLREIGTAPLDTPSDGQH